MSLHVPQRRVFTNFAIGIILSALPAMGSGTSPERLSLYQAPPYPELPQLDAEVIEKAQVQTTRRGTPHIAPNEDGSLDVVVSYYPDYGGRADLLFMDLGTGEQNWLNFTPGEEVNNFHMTIGVLAPNGKLFISSLVKSKELPFWRQRVSIYDPKTNTFTLDAVKLPITILGETHPMVLGPDGKLHCGGAHPDGKITSVTIDPDTLEVTDHGAINDSGETGERHGGSVYSLGADDRFTYLVSGKLPWRLHALDRQTGKTELLQSVPDSSTGYGISIVNHQGGCLVTNQREGQPPTSFFLRHGKLTLRESPDQLPPWEPVEPQKVATGTQTIALIDAAPSLNGEAALWWRSIPEGQTAPPSFITNIQHHQQLTDGQWTRVPYQVPLYPNDLARVHATSDGRIFATSVNYNGAFIYNPTTEEVEPHPNIYLSHYSTTAQGDKLYMSGYPNAPLIEYNTSQPWTLNTPDETGRMFNIDNPASNPRKVTHLKESRVHKMLTAATGSDGVVYFGGHRMRNGAIGGIGWYNPEDQTQGGLWEEISNYRVHSMAAIGDNIAISAAKCEDPVLHKPTPEQGAILFLNTKTKTISGKAEPLPGAPWPGPIASNGKVIIGWAPGETKDAPSKLYTLDPTTHNVLRIREVAHSVGDMDYARHDFQIGPDGHVWTYFGSLLVRINPENLEIEPITLLRQGRGRMAFIGRDLYIGVVNLIVYRDIVPEYPAGE